MRNFKFLFLALIVMCSLGMLFSFAKKDNLQTKQNFAVTGGDQSLTGGGTAQEVYDDPNKYSRSTVTINAIKKSNGSVNGHLTYIYRAGEFNFDADIDCLIIAGNIASVSGTIKKVGGKNASSFPNYYVGQRIQISIQDNGNDQDLMSDLNRGAGLNCATPPVDGPYIPISGNFTIHQ